MSAQPIDATPSGPLAKWQAVADAIAAHITSGQVRRGDHLPPVHQIARRYGVGAPTVWRAVHSLAAEGMVTIRDGRLTVAVGSTRRSLTAVKPPAAPALVPPLDGGETWQEHALCAQVGGDEWFPEIGDSMDDARQICGRCPVATACLRDALATDERFGIRGGLSPRQRTSLKRRQAAS